MTFQTKVTVDGIDVTSFVSQYQVIDTIKDITPAKIIFGTSVSDILSLEKNQEIIITRGEITSTDKVIFRGNISAIQKVSGYNITVEAFDKLWLLARQTITISYDQNTGDENGIISAIASDLITRGGLTPDIEISSTATKLKKYIIRSKSILDKLQDLADLINYWVYYNPDTDTVNFKSRGFETFATTLKVGTNLTLVPTWTYDYTKMANDVTIVGDLQEIETTETFTSGVTSITLNQKPESVKVFMEDSKDVLILQTGGVIGQSTSFDYSIDKENSKINFVSTTSGTANTWYSYLIPIKVRKKNPTSISKYGSYQVTKTIDTIQTTEDAEIKVNEVINKFGEPIVNASNVKLYNIFGGNAGQQVKIEDSINDENRLVNIKRYVYNYPNIIDEIDVDDEPMYEDYILMNVFRKRIENLERRNESEGGLINQLFSLDRTFEPRRRFSKLQKETLSNPGLILGDVTYGVLGTGILGQQFNPSTTLKLIQGDMTYYEDLRDTTFVDSESTDAVVTSTGTNPSVATIEFSSGSVFQTSAIDLGTTLSSYRLDSGSASGSFKYEISNDSKNNWQQFSTGVVVNITNSGTSTYLRITEDAGDSGTIRNVTNDNGEVITPTLKLILNE